MDRDKVKATGIGGCGDRGSEINRIKGNRRNEGNIEMLKQVIIRRCYKKKGK